jgi:3-dehydroquinate dehydratase
MPEPMKNLHTIRSKTTSLKEAAEFLHKCPDEKRLPRVALMRETAQDIVRLLTELEAELQKPG